MKNIAILFFVCFPFISQAQNNSTSKNLTDTSDYKVMLHFGSFYQNQSFKNLNGRLATLGSTYNSLPQSLVGWNFGWTSEKRRFLTKLNLGLATGTKGNEEKRNTKLFTIESSFELGYNVSKNKNIRFYPLVGFGASTFRATLNKDLSNINFNDVLQNPTVQANTNPVKLSNTFFNYRLGFAVDFINKKNNNLAFGLHAGYTGSFRKMNWRVNELQEVSNAPIDGLSQLYVGINFLMQRHRRR